MKSLLREAEEKPVYSNNTNNDNINDDEVEQQHYHKRQYILQVSGAVIALNIFLLYGLPTVAVIISIIILITYLSGYMFIEIRDENDKLLICNGPGKWLYFGYSTELIPYDQIISAQIVTKSCAACIPTPRIQCCGTRQFAAWSYCCKPLYGKKSCNQMMMTTVCEPKLCCQQTIVQIVVKETYIAQHSQQYVGCFERCCIGFFLSRKRGKFWGDGACCQCFNCCKANCCMYDIIYVSTNDPNGLVDLIHNKKEEKSVMI